MAKTKMQKGRGSVSKQKRRIKNTITTVVVIAAIIGIYIVVDQLAPTPPGFAVQDAGRGHMPACQPDYNTRPPTSGCHFPNITDYAIFDEPQDDRVLVHNLEHGAVIISYRTSGIPGEDDLLIQDITSFVTDLKNSDRKYCRIIVNPSINPFSAEQVAELRDEAFGAKIALTAWRYIDVMTTFDEERVKSFIDAHIDKGPERNADNCR